jgi:hypothetical protein
MHGASTVGNILLLYKILGLHCGDYEECLPLGCDAVWLFTLMMEAARSFETSVLTRPTRHHILGDCILRICYCSVFIGCCSVNLNFSAANKSLEAQNGDPVENGCTDFD